MSQEIISGPSACSISVGDTSFVGSAWDPRLGLIALAILPEQRRAKVIAPLH